MHAPQKLIRSRDIAMVVGLSRSQIYVAMNEGTFPRPVRIGKRTVAWRSDEIAAWIDSRPRAGAQSAA